LPELLSVPCPKVHNASIPALSERRTRTQSIPGALRASGLQARGRLRARDRRATVLGADHRALRAGRARRTGRRLRYRRRPRQAHESELLHTSTRRDLARIDISLRIDREMMQPAKVARLGRALAELIEHLETHPIHDCDA